jgi:predicted permease
MESLLQDIRYAFRTLVKNPSFTVIAIATLTIGIGANSAIFSMVNAVLLSPLPFKEPDQLVMIYHRYPQLDAPRALISPPSFSIYKGQSEVFEQAAAYAMRNYNITSIDQPEQLQVMLVSSGFFETLGVTPILGRTFLPEEDQFGNNRVVILSHGLWQRHFGSDASALNKTLTLNGVEFRAVGVMPLGFQFIDHADVWTPLALTPNQLNPSQHGNEYLSMVARLKPGMSLKQAQSQMDGLSVQLRHEFPRAYPEGSDWNIGLLKLREQMVGDARPSLLILLGAVGLVLLIACSNVANLLLARAVSRQKEIAIRTALGASHFRLIRQLLTESILLSVVGGAIGFVLAYWAINLLATLMPASLSQFMGKRSITTDGSVLLFTFAVSVLTGLLFGIAPAQMTSRTDLAQALKEGGRSSQEVSGGNYIRRLLVVAEVALAFLLLIGAGLLLRSFVRLQDVDPGFRVNNVLTTQLSLPRYKYREDRQMATFYQQLLTNLGTVPEIKEAGVVSDLPLTKSGRDAFLVIEGRPQPPGGPGEHVDYRSASPDYFSAIGIPMLAGRSFTEHDTPDTPAVAIVDQAVAQRFWPNQDPLGKRLALTFEGASGQPRWREIVGVVGKVKQRALDSESEAQLYLPQFQDPARSVYLVVHTTSEPMAMLGSVRTVLRQLDRDQPINKALAMEQVMASSLAPRRFSTLLLAIFAGMSVMLASIGLYGLLAYSVSQRKHEIGVRMALGAQSLDVIKLIVREGLSLTVFGIVVGLLAALALTRFITILLFSVSPTDPATFVGVSVILLAVTLLASYVPARRATRTDPIIALRAE